MFLQLPTKIPFCCRDSFLCYNQFWVNYSTNKTINSLIFHLRGMKTKEKELFNPAFKHLRRKLEHQKQLLEKEQQSRERKDSSPHEDLYFQEAFSDVVPLSKEKSRVSRNPGMTPKPSHPAPNQAEKARAYLHGLLKGSIEMDITFSDEYIEGCVKGFSPKLMKRLKKGEFPVQDFIDLHGLTRHEAKELVQEFLLRSHRMGLRCVLVVHGRGLNSPDSFPVIKEGLPLWLGSGAVRKVVLAFASARPYDGGTGALYVLLRKR